MTDTPDPTDKPDLLDRPDLLNRKEDVEIVVQFLRAQKDREGGTALNNEADNFLKRFEEQHSDFDAFRDLLTEAVRDLDQPFTILIDEPDRCRLTYSIEMLERLKHLFDIPKVAFVVATDTEQLQHAIKAVYGEGFHAKAYLRRFANH